MVKLRKPKQFTRKGRLDLVHGEAMRLMQYDIDYSTQCRSLKGYETAAEEFVQGLEDGKYVVPGLQEQISTATNPEWLKYRRRRG